MRALSFTPSCTKNDDPDIGKIALDDYCAERCPAAAGDMQKFFYNVTKAGEGKYGNLVQIERNGNAAA